MARKVRGMTPSAQRLRSRARRSGGGYEERQLLGNSREETFGIRGTECTNPAATITLAVFEGEQLVRRQLSIRVVETWIASSGGDSQVAKSMSAGRPFILRRLHPRPCCVPARVWQPNGAVFVQRVDDTPQPPRT